LGVSCSETKRHIYSPSKYLTDDKVSWLHGEIRPDMFPHIPDDDRLFLVLMLLALFFGLFWWWNRRAKKWLEENGRTEELPNALEWLLGERQPKPKTALKYSEQEFQEMVSRALDEVPQEFDRKVIWYSELILELTGPKDSVQTVPDTSSLSFNL
jgi:hypothetical protein